MKYMVLALIGLLLLPACHKSSSSGGDDTDTGTDADSDTDVDTDSDSDIDSDTDTDTDTDTGSDTVEGCGDKESELEWAKAISGSSVVVHHMDWIPSGEFFLVGWFQNYVTFGQGEPNETTLGPAGWMASYVAKYDADGSLAWVEEITEAEVQNTPYGVAALPSGEVFVTGDYRGPAVFGPGDANETVLDGEPDDDDAYLAKYDADGALLWVERIGGANGTDWATAPAALPDGSALVTGSFEAEQAVFGAGQPGEVVLNLIGWNDMYLARYLADGTLDWVQHAGGASHDIGFDVAVLGDDTVLVTGEFYGDATFDIDGPSETTVPASGAPTLFVAAYELDGSFDWVRSPGMGTGYDIEPLGSDQALVVGLFENTVVFGEGEANETELISLGFRDAFAAKYESHGALVWARHIAGGPETDGGLGVSLFADGSYVVAGAFEETVELEPGVDGGCTLVSAGDQDAWIARYSDDGTFHWGFGLGAEHTDWAEAVEVTLDGSVLVTGEFSDTVVFGEGGPEETELMANVGWNVFLAQYEP